MQQDLALWDGKSSTDIQNIYHSHNNGRHFVPDIVNLITSGTQSKGASWLLKRYLENDGKLTNQQIHQIYKALPIINNWETRLHLLQSIPYLPISNTDKNTVEDFVRDGLTGLNKFVRAWSYHGFYELARTFPEFRTEAKQLFELAMNDEAASVKARIRNLKKGF